jgi:hypothetical protein
MMTDATTRHTVRRSTGLFGFFGRDDRGSRARATTYRKDPNPKLVRVHFTGSERYAVVDGGVRYF